MRPTVAITPKGEERLHVGHPWIYRSDVADVQATGGDIVSVHGKSGRPLGRAFYSDRSQIALRLLTTSDSEIDRGFWIRRIQAAIDFRATLNIDATAYRLVHAEADLLPSIVVDRYGDHLVVQTLSQGADRLLPELVEMLVDLTTPAGVLARNDPRVRELEGLDRRVEVIFGDVPEAVMVRDAAVCYEANLWKGQKTGLFLDQRENRLATAQYARGRLLDCFSYQGGFSLALARACSDVLAVDISEDSVRQIQHNAARNGLSNVTARVANVFDELRELERSGRRFDVIVLDPPAFAKNKHSVPKALAGYKEINLRALKLLTSGGYLVTCSCSYNVDEATFGQVVYEAALDARALVTVVEKRMQSRDHPVLLGVPETYYLKCFIVRKIA